MSYERSYAHKKRMSEVCRKNARGPHLEKKKIKHRICDGVEQRFCSYCVGWYRLSGMHFRARRIKSRSGFSAYFAYDCRKLQKPKMAYYSARWRCAHLKTYKGKTVKITQPDFVRWWLAEQDRLNLSDPVVDRIDNDGHYEIRNIQLIERSANSSKYQAELRKRLAILEYENFELRKQLEGKNGM